MGLSELALLMHSTAKVHLYVLCAAAHKTYLRIREGWLYLCAVRDCCSRRVLGWAMDSVQNTDLVERALRMAYTLRGELHTDLVFHAD